MATNYDKMKEDARKRFLKYDFEEIARSFGLTIDERYLHLEFLGEDFRIERGSGFAECVDIRTKAFREADCNEALTVYDILSRYQTPPHAAGEFIHLNSLHTLTGSASAPSPDGFYSRYAGSLDHKTEALKKVFDLLGGIPDDRGDAAAKIRVFGDLYILVRFWDCDEEFPADLQFLPDSGILTYMHYETVWYVCLSLMDRIRQLMDAAN